MSKKEVKNQYKVLRLFDGGAEPSDGWHEITSAYGVNDILQIKDPAGASSKNEITSIPSPFARIHLFESAYRIVAENSINDLNALDGDTIYHKLISDSLDVGELFYSFDTLSEVHDIEVIKWNKDKEIYGLLNSSYSEHQLLGETLRLFIEQDGKMSNLDVVENLYFISVDHNIVGGTSPSTLFFSSGNDMSFLNITKGRKTFFDDRYYPLYKRDADFQLYIYTLFNAYPELKQKMSFLWKYLIQNQLELKQTDKSLFDKIVKLESNGKERVVESLEKSFRKWESDRTIEIFPDIYHFKREDKEIEAGDFKIAYTNGTHDKVPVVLQKGFGKPLNYFGRPWDADIDVPYIDKKPLKDRLAPAQNVKYPYLTVSDFLEPYLIEVPYAIDREYFFDGNPEGVFQGDKHINKPPDNMYLIPIKRTYFDYFGIKDLKGTNADGEKNFRMVKVGIDAVRVDLVIPISKEGEYIKLERMYYPGGRPDEKANKGAIVNCLFNIGMLPFKPIEGVASQHVGLIDTDVIFSDETESQYNLTFLENTNKGSIPKPVELETIRSDESKNHQHNATSKYYYIGSNYDIIEVNKNNISGLIVLDSKTNIEKGNQSFTFAVDFGTTNTHIEYIDKPNGNPKAFEISEKDRQLITLADHEWGSLEYPQLSELLIRELMPITIGNSTNFSFPTRTVTTEIKSINHSQATTALGDISIPFYYQSLYLLESEVVVPNLKWKTLRGVEGVANENRVKAFIESIILMLKNKVLLNNGDLSKTELIWFYPASMSTHQVESYKAIWNRLYKKHFNQEGETKVFSESVAPFYNYSENIVKSKQYPVVNIDIGGGTSDIVVFKDSKPVLLTSMKFGGNAVFGDGYDETTIIKNGIVKAFTDDVEHFLESNIDKLYNINRVFTQLSESGSSVENMNFFFSLDTNKDLENNQLDFNFSELLAQHPKFGIVFLVFYSALIYHLAKLMNKLELDKPRNICLSGNGSKIVNLLDSSPKLKGIEGLTKRIFNKFWDKSETKVNNPESAENKYHSEGLDIFQEVFPKQATSKGGISMRTKKKEESRLEKIVLLGDGTGRYINNSLDESTDNHKGDKIKYRDLSSDDKEEVVNEVKNFIDMLFSIHEEYNFENYFGISSKALREYRSELKHDLRSNLETGLSKRMELSDQDKNIEETLFFYPLVGSLHHLAQIIADDESEVY